MYASAAACNAGAVPRHRGGITCNPQLSPTVIAMSNIGGVIAHNIMGIPKRKVNAKARYSPMNKPTAVTRCCESALRSGKNAPLQEHRAP